MSTALVPVVAAVVEQQASQVVGTVRYVEGRLVVKLSPSAVPSSAPAAACGQCGGDCSRFGPLGPFHPCRGYEGPLRYRGGLSEAERVELRQEFARWDRRGQLPWLLRWAWRWVG